MRIIDADALLDAMPKSDVLLRHQVVDAICNSTPIDVAPVVHGHWIKVSGGNGLVYTIRCSECDNFDNPSYILGNYCWFCGAKMDGGEDGENEHEV